jgi:imidazole glycerol-phosphate synthase subunit HisF
MLKTRVIPCLLLKKEGLVKTKNFKSETYIGDAINTVRIFNEMEVDELIVLDILASKENLEPNFDLIRHIADECFMPLSYGGGIRNIKDINRIFNIGVEKISINSSTIDNPELIKNAAEVFGSQSVIVSIDVKTNFWNKYDVYTHGGTKKHKINPTDHARNMEALGAGEILLTSINNEGTWKGYDYTIVKTIASSVSIPVISNGGAGKIEHMSYAVNNAGASAVALGSMVVYQGQDLGVLINFPDKCELERALN